MKATLTVFLAVFLIFVAVNTALPLSNEELEQALRD